MKSPSSPMSPLVLNKGNALGASEEEPPACSDKRSLRRRASAANSDARGEAIPVAILFLGVIFTIFLGVHLVIMAMARTAVQSAADAAVVAAQSALPSERVAEGMLAARIALVASSSTVRETRPPAIVVENGRGVVQALVFAGAISPILGGVEVTALACGPLDNLTASELTETDPWTC